MPEDTALIALRGHGLQQLNEDLAIADLYIEGAEVTLARCRLMRTRVLAVMAEKATKAAGDQ